MLARRRAGCLFKAAGRPPSRGSPCLGHPIVWPGEAPFLFEDPVEVLPRSWTVGTRSHLLILLHLRFLFDFPNDRIFIGQNFNDFGVFNNYSIFIYIYTYVCCIPLYNFFLYFIFYVISIVGRSVRIVGRESILTDRPQPSGVVF